MSNDIRYFTSTSFRRGYCVDITDKNDFNVDEDITYSQSYYSIVLLHKNSKNIRINFKELTSADNLLIIRPEDTVSYEEDGELDFIELCFDDSFFDILSEKDEFKAAYPFIFNRWNANSWHVDDALSALIEEKVLSIKSILCNDRSLKSKYMVFALLTNCLTLLDHTLTELGGQYCEEAQNARETPVANRFYTLVNKHFKKECNVAFYASQLCMTTNNLCRIIKAATGKTTKQIITLRKIHEAQRLLAYSDKDIHNIATSLGYPDTKEFCRAFKKHTGLLPAEYRNKKIHIKL